MRSGPAGQRLSEANGQDKKQERKNTMHKRINHISAWIIVAALLVAIGPGRAEATGDVTTAGYEILRVDDVYDTLGVTGDGFKVGVISDGAEHWQAVAESGDLPVSIELFDNSTGIGDEGTAMMEIIYDLAPGVEFYFAGVEVDLDEDSTEMVAAIEWLVGEGCDIIVDGLTFYDEPMFEDGDVADAAAAAVTAGVVYVTSAGDDAEKHHQRYYTPEYEGTRHLFEGTQESNPQPHWAFEVGPSETALTIEGFLQWSDEWGESGNDYNLYLEKQYDVPYKHWDYVGWSENRQNGDDDPFEHVVYTTAVPSFAESLRWSIRLVNEGEVCELEFFHVGPGVWYKIWPLPEPVLRDSIFGHAAVESVITVGAIAANDQGHDEVNASSSQGPSTVYDFTQTPPERIERSSLDVCGIDGVSTKVYYPDPFYGTSAAAAHIAGIAALLLEIDGTLTPSEVQDRINDGAVNIYGDEEYDDVTGYGRADAFKAAIPMGDMNGDTLVNAQDINPFVQALTNFTAWQATYPALNILDVGDCSDDELFNAQDINPFVVILTSGKDGGGDDDEKEEGGGKDATYPTLFFSDKGPGENPTKVNPSIALDVDEEATLYIWADLGEDDIINGLGIDVLCETSGIVSADSCDIENPTIFFKDRWDGTVDEGTVGELVTDVKAVAVSGVGLYGGAGVYDPTYDEGSGYYLVGTIEYTADADGSTDVFIQTNDMTISFRADSGGPDIHFGTGDDEIDPGTSGISSSSADATITVSP